MLHCYELHLRLSAFLLLYVLLYRLVLFGFEE